MTHPSPKKEEVKPCCEKCIVTELLNDGLINDYIPLSTPVCSNPYCPCHSKVEDSKKEECGNPISHKNKLCNCFPLNQAPEEKKEWDFDDKTAPANCILKVNDKGDRVWSLQAPKEEILYFCSRCHLKFQVMGEVLEWGKTYPAYTIKSKDGTIENRPENREIKKALCKTCMIEVGKSNFDISQAPESKEVELEARFNKTFREDGEYKFRGATAVMAFVFEEISKARSEAYEKGKQVNKIYFLERVKLRVEALDAYKQSLCEEVEKMKCTGLMKDLPEMREFNHALDKVLSLIRQKEK